MKPKKDCRGFSTYCDFKCTYGTEVRVKESSAGSAPHIWLFLNEDPTILTRPALGNAAAHLTVKQANKLAQALLDACKSHYQLRGEKE